MREESRVCTECGRVVEGLACAAHALRGTVALNSRAMISVALPDYGTVSIRFDWCFEIGTRPITDTDLEILRDALRSILCARIDGDAPFFIFPINREDGIWIRVAREEMRADCAAKVESGAGGSSLGKEGGGVMAWSWIVESEDLEPRERELAAAAAYGLADEEEARVAVDRWILDNGYGLLSDPGRHNIVYELWREEVE